MSTDLKELKNEFSQICEKAEEIEKICETL